MSLSGIGYNSTTDLYALEAEKKESTASKADKVNASTEEAPKQKQIKTKILPQSMTRESCPQMTESPSLPSSRQIRRSARAS